MDIGQRRPQGPQHLVLSLHHARTSRSNHLIGSAGARELSWLAIFKYLEIFPRTEAASLLNETHDRVDLDAQHHVKLRALY